MKRLAQLLSFGLGLYAALLPWQTRLIVSQPLLGTKPTEYGTLSLYATDLLLIALVIGTALLGQRSQGNRRVWGAAAVLIVIALGSAIMANRADVAVASIHLLLVGAAILWLIQQPWVSRRYVLACFVAGAGLQALIGIGQLLFQWSPAISWLGLAQHDPSVSGTSVVSSGGMRWLRAYGSLPHPNILGGYLAAAWLVTFGLYLHAYDTVQDGFRRWTRENVRRHIEGRTWYARQAWHLVALLFVGGLLTVGTLLSFSRSAWIGLAVAWLFTLATLLVMRWPGGLWLWAKWTFYTGLVASVVILATPATFVGRTNTTNDLERVSVNERQQQYRDAYQLLKEFPLRGVGLGNMVVATYDQLTNNRTSVDAYQPVHNIYLLATVELGILGGLAFFVFILAAYWASLTQLLRRTAWYSVAAAGALTCLLVIGLLDHYLWDLGAGVAVLWLMVGVGSREDA